MSSKRTLEKDPAEVVQRLEKLAVIQRLERLAEHIRRDKEIMKKLREEWYREYIKDTGIRELFIKHGEKGFTREDITHEEFDASFIDYQIKYIKNDLGNN